ncbi:zinc knuckle CX2CX4HX4C containing protein, partial [Tanacetum coccineum]
MRDFVTGYSLKDKNKAKPGKTESGIGKSVKNRSQSRVPLVHEENPNLIGDTFVKDKVVQSDGQQVTAMKEAQSSFASVLLKSQSKQTVKISEMHNMEAVEGARVTIPMTAVEENTWAKFRLIRVMLEDDFFLFQFETKDGMEKVMEGGPWLIKLHHVSIVAYSEVGLSLIMTQIGRPIMLDTYTSSMYLKSWGRKEYDRALVEVSAEEELMESMVIAIPKNDGKGHSLATITIEYEWKPPRCDLCKVFDHMDDKCPKKTKAVETMKVDSDGFTEKEVNEAKQTVHDKTSKNTTNVRVTNSFSALSTTEADENDWGTNEKWKEASYSINESDSEEVEELIIEDRQASWNIRGLNFSPKQSEVHQIIYDNKLSICAILESHARDSNLECVDEIKVMDVPSSGLHFTWNQKPKGAHVIFQPYRTSDHAPAVLVIPTTSKSSPKPFKFSNILTHHSRFKEVVSEGWSLEVSGFCMFRLAKKLKNLKKPLRKLLYDHGNLHDNVNRLRTELDRVQADLDPDPFNAELREEEVAYVQAYNQAILMQERFLKQKAK